MLFLYVKVAYTHKTKKSVYVYTHSHRKKSAYMSFGSEVFGPRYFGSKVLVLSGFGPRY